MVQPTRLLEVQGFVLENYYINGVADFIAVEFFPYRANPIGKVLDRYEIYGLVEDN